MSVFYKHQWYFDIRRLKHVVITSKCVKRIAKINIKTKTFLSTKKIKSYFCEEHWNIFFYFIGVIYKDNCRNNKINIKIMLQFISYKNCGCYFFCILINHNHTNHVIDRIIKK